MRRKPGLSRLDVRPAERPFGRAVQGEQTITGSATPTTGPAAPHQGRQPGRPVAVPSAANGAGGGPATHPAPWIPPAPAAAEPAEAGPVAAVGPGWDLDLAALAEVERKLIELATGLVDPADDRAPAQRAAVSATSSIATVLWFDALRASDRVSVTPAAAPLVRAVHLLLDGAHLDAPAGARAGGAASGGAAGAPGPEAGAGQASPAGARPRPVRATGAGTSGPSGTLWAALARRYAAERFDHAPEGRQICILDYPELRDPAVWEAVTDERAAHLGELLWVVTVCGSAPTGAPGGIGGPARAARMFEAAGWQVLTLRHGRRLGELFRRPGGPALQQRLASLSPAESRSLLHARGTELRRRLTGPGVSGIGISRLLDTLTDDEVLAAVRDLGGHDHPLLVDAFDEVDPARPTVLFAYTDDGRAGATTVRDAAFAPGRHALPGGAEGPAALPARPGPRGAGGGGGAGSGPLERPGPWAWPEPLPANSRGALLCSRVAAALSRPPSGPLDPPAVPADLGRSYAGPLSTQAALGSVLHDLTAVAPTAAAAVVTVSTSEADRVVAGWITAHPGGTGSVAPLPDRPLRRADTYPAGALPAPGPGPGPGPVDTVAAARPASATYPAPTVAAGSGHLPGSAAGSGGRDEPAGRHVAGGLSAGAFGGVLSSLSVAWSRYGLPLLPLGVADEAAAATVLPGWSAGASADARSVLAIADTPRSSAPGAAWVGRSAVPGAVCWEPAFAQDLAWVSLAAFGSLARPGGISSVIRLSARQVEQRLADVPPDELGRRMRRAHVLAGSYRLRDGGARPALTIVGMGPVMPEVLRAADELSAAIGRGVGVVCVTSTELLFHALQARRGLADGSAAVLEEVFPRDRRSPLLTVVDGDPQRLAFLAGLHGDPITTLGSGSTSDGGVGPDPGTGAHAAGWAAPPAPVDLRLIIGAALDLLDEAESSAD